jgi:hypothetical protein
VSVYQRRGEADEQCSVVDELGLSAVRETDLSFRVMLTSFLTFPKANDVLADDLDFRGFEHNFSKFQAVQILAALRQVCGFIARLLR